jgi:hypothetical protein
MRAHIPLVSVAVISGLSLLACGGGPIGSTLRGGKSWSPSPQDPSLLHAQFHVPPDRSLLPITVWASAPSPGDAAAQVRADLDALAVALTDATGCSLQVHGYDPPGRNDSDSDSWVATTQAVLDVDLTGLSDARARMDRIDSCRGLLLPRTTYGEEDVSGTDRTHDLTLFDGALYVDAPEKHLPALLERRARALSTVADRTGAPQLHPEDYRCVPTGGVTVGARTLEGVVLTLDVQCRVDGPPSPPKEG